MTRLNLSTDRTIRLDELIAPQLNSSHFRSVQALIEAGHVFVGGQRVRRTQFMVRSNQPVVVHDVAQKPAPKITLLHEDEHLIVINKASGDHVNQTETSPKLSIIEKINESWPNAQLVHRLDRETTGVLLLAKDAASGRGLSANFADRKIHKTYLALVEGCAFPDSLLAGSIARDSRRPRCFRVHASGKNSETKVTFLSSCDEITAVMAEPLTGRTHQIRVHLSHAGAPILGDQLYGGPSAVRLAGEVIEAPRVMLHAAKLSIPVWPDSPRAPFLEFSADFPDDFRLFQDKGLALDALFA